MSDDTRLLRKLYAAFNARDVERALAGMHGDVDWANGLEGGSVSGHDAVRAYWTRQWRSIDPHVEPVGFALLAPDTIAVDVHQIVRDRAGNLRSDQRVRHVYVMEGGLVRSMRILRPDAAN